MTTGTLYVVSTPIGNLEDITHRALRVLAEVDLIAAEDTRRTAALLKHYGIHTRQRSYHDFNKERVTPSLLDVLRGGQSIALVSDAGTPGISDPCYYLVVRAIRTGIPVVPIPGPTAPIAALSVSGLPLDRFVFEGFLPAKKGRQKRLEQLRAEERTIVLFESPHRLLRTLDELLRVLGDRGAAVAREITKRFEEIFRGTLSQAAAHFRQKPVKGEFVLIIEGAGKNKRGASILPSNPDRQISIDNVPQDGTLHS